jgi:hypothetical protein
MSHAHRHDSHMLLPKLCLVGTQAQQLRLRPTISLAAARSVPGLCVGGACVVQHTGLVDRYVLVIYSLHLWDPSLVGWAAQDTAHAAGAHCGSIDIFCAPP